MNKAYNRINNGNGWENYPSDKTPLNKYNLDKGDVALDEIDNRVIVLDSTKATKIEVSPLFKDVSYDDQTGIITFTRKNGATVTIDTPMEKIQTGIYYDPVTEMLTLPLIDGTTMGVDLSRLITEFEFLDSDTIAFSVGAEGYVSAIIKEGSIGERHLRPDYLADIHIESERAASSAAEAESWARGGTGTRPGEDLDNAMEYARQAKESADRAGEILSGSITEINLTKTLDNIWEDTGSSGIFLKDGAYAVKAFVSIHVPEGLYAQTEFKSIYSGIMSWKSVMGYNLTEEVVLNFSGETPDDLRFFIRTRGNQNKETCLQACFNHYISNKNVYADIIISFLKIF
ncbi:hypothetical protein C805_00090 [Eubacterium sp. 14-2]|uniref:hypothetical protein n=1 Tax=Eubacterium sp. 14-2 TaxID=1235790 RepID=UPI000337E0F9|nr:hypothetical protein [Eubacterium sp. 14-2]EOT29506.1 hypothetical protein C805_00090 [Eubacterium sp. 14-2]